MVLIDDDDVDEWIICSRYISSQRSESTSRCKVYSRATLRLYVFTDRIKEKRKLETIMSTAPTKKLGGRTAIVSLSPSSRITLTPNPYPLTDLNRHLSHEPGRMRLPWPALPPGSRRQDQEQPCEQGRRFL